MVSGLQQLSRKPLHLEFVECKPSHTAQLRALSAIYRVKGSDAASVERYLMRHTRMPALRFACCGWEPYSRRNPLVVAGYLPSRYGFNFEISMGSETLVTRRAEWNQIPWFYVEVLLPLESP